MIAGKVANALALDWPRDRLEVIVACDGSPDDTPARARAAGADRRPRPAVGREDPRPGCRGGRGARRPPRVLRRQRALGAGRALPRSSPASPTRAWATSAARCASSSDGGTNQEGLYWRYEMAIRGLKSDLASVTAGNGAIYAVRPEAYVNVDQVMGHDLTLPFTLVKRGWARSTNRAPGRARRWSDDRARVRPQAPDDEPHVADRAARRDALACGYPPLYALMIGSHRVLRYVGPFLHVVALLASIVLARGRAGDGSRAPRSPRRPRCSAPPRRAGACARGRSWWRATNAHNGVDRRRPVGPPAPRDGGGVVAARGHALSRGGRPRRTARRAATG